MAESRRLPRLTLLLARQFHAMDTLQKNGYDLASAMSTLVPQGGPVLCRDEMEEWSASEAMLFEEALEKYGKDFTDIRQDFVSASARPAWAWIIQPLKPRTGNAELMSFLPPLSCRGNLWPAWFSSTTCGRRRTATSNR